MSLSKWVTWRTLNAKPFEYQGVWITPQMQSLQINLPFGGFVWSRPTAVLVQSGAQRRVIPITDTTRIAQLLIVLSAILLFVHLRRTYLNDAR